MKNLKQLNNNVLLKRIIITMNSLRKLFHAFPIWIVMMLVQLIIQSTLMLSLKYVSVSDVSIPTCSSKYRKKSFFHYRCNSTQAVPSNPLPINNDKYDHELILVNLHSSPKITQIGDPYHQFEVKPCPNGMFFCKQPK